MTHTVPLLDRRRFLGVLAGLPIVGRAGAARAMRPAFATPVFPDSATIVVAGPDGGDLDQWSGVMLPALSKGLPPGTPLRRVTTGAPDGVTGANQFNASSAPDGETVLLAPGEAALSWLVGDPRAHYDIARWVSLMIVVTPGLIMARPGALAPSQAVRLATTGPATADLPALLGIELLGARVEPQPMLPDEAQIAAFAHGGVDAVFLRGHKVEERAAALTATGAQPAFSLGALDETGELSRCSLFPAVPTLPELEHVPAVHLLAAWQAAAIASMMECALVLPQLTPAATVALWRSAGAAAAATQDVQAVAMSLGVRAVGGAEATATSGAVAADEAAQNDLRTWLATRFDWRPT
jgi:hypothetical protein